MTATYRLGGTALTLATALSLFTSAPAPAAPVLYRISSLTGSNFFTVLPAPFHPPMTIPSSSPAVASIMTNGTQPASVAFQSGDIVYSNRFLLPTPPTAFGVFYSSQGWQLSNKAGTLGPNPGAVTSTGVPDGFSARPPFFSSTGPQPSAALVRVKPGPAKFGGAWDLGHRFDSLQVLAKVGGGFRAGNTRSPQLLGRSATIANSNPAITPFHSTPGFTSPIFSSTACPTTPATCPWAGATTPLQQEHTGVRWTTGMVTVVNALPPITLLPPTGTLIATGADNRSGPNSSMGTLQLVSAFNSFGRGAIPVSVLSQWDLTLTFLPEPSATVMLAAGIGVLLGLWQVRGRS